MESGMNLFLFGWWVRTSESKKIINSIARFQLFMHTALRELVADYALKKPRLRRRPGKWRLSEDFAFACARKGLLGLLQWARREQKCPWDEWTIACAAREGRLEVLPRGGGSGVRAARVTSGCSLKQPEKGTWRCCREGVAPRGGLPVGHVGAQSNRRRRELGGAEVAPEQRLPMGHVDVRSRRRRRAHGCAEVAPERRLPMGQVDLRFRRRWRGPGGAEVAREGGLPAERVKS